MVHLFSLCVALLLKTAVQQTKNGQGAAIAADDNFRYIRCMLPLVTQWPRNPSDIFLSAVYAKYLRETAAVRFQYAVLVHKAETRRSAVETLRAHSPPARLAPRCRRLWPRPETPTSPRRRCLTSWSGTGVYAGRDRHDVRRLAR